MTVKESIRFMKKNPGVKTTKSDHYRSWQYNYYDEKLDKVLCENGEEFSLSLSIECNEIDNFNVINGGEKVDQKRIDENRKGA